MENYIEYDNNGYLHGAQVDGVFFRADRDNPHPVLAIAPKHILEYNGWDTRPFILLVDENYKGPINSKVEQF